MKYVSLFLLLVALSGCVTTSMKDALGFDYEPIYLNHDVAPEDKLIELSEHLEAKGYKVSYNPIFLTITTSPIDLGYQVWRENNEKWKLSYSLGIQIIRSRNDMYFWRVAYSIDGSRQGRENRIFNPEDFEETESLSYEIERELFNALNNT